MKKQFLTQINLKFLSLLCLLAFSFNASAQWLEWQDLTSTNLVLTTVANSDDEEKDMVAADLDNDGRTDVIVVRKEPFSLPSQPEKSDLLLMNVDGVLTDQTMTYAPEFLSNATFARDVHVADFDGDGWQDVVVANTFDQQPIYYKNRGNDGSGNWLGLQDETASRFPLLTEDEILFCAVWSGDVTGNGALDIYFINYTLDNSSVAKDFLLINDGTGVFTNESQARLGDFRNSAFGTSVEIHDMDNDGDQDIIKNSVLFDVAPWNEGGLFILYNNGTGNFPNYQSISPSEASYMFTVQDFNLDGKLDLYVVDDTDDFQLTAGVITPNSNIAYNVNFLTSNRVSGFGGNVHAADLDLDGDMDVAVADVDVDIPPCDSGRVFAFLENSAGNITDTYIASATALWDENAYDYSFLDVNDDGLTDVLIGRCEGYQLLLSDNCDLVTSSADYDGDGLADACDDCPTNPDPNCVPPTDYPIIDDNLNIAHQWNEMLLASIRKDFARPTVHARNLYHLSVAMWDIWAYYNSPAACTYLLGKTVDGFTCDFNGFTPQNSDLDLNLHEALSYASYRILSHRFANSPDATNLQTGYDTHMMTLGYDINFTSTDYSTGSAAAFGNYMAQCIIDFGLQDGSNEANDYGNTSYTPVNDALIVDQSGNPTISDYNRWQPLTLDLFIDQSGNEIPGSTPEFLSPEWGQVSAFCLSTDDLTINSRNGFEYWVYHDPSGPPTMELDGSGTTADYRWGFETVVTWSSHLDATDGAMIDISPAVMGNLAVSDYPTSVSDYPNFYDQLLGGTTANGYNANPTSNLPYASNVVPRGDFARVLAEFWADGPDSETPPGHWFTLANEVSEHSLFEKKFEGQGPILDDTEWFVKLYFALGGAMHDAAVTSWGIKGWYDYLRPVSAIRAMADLGQSSNSNSPSYHPAGISLIPNYIELITVNDALAGDNNENVGKIKIKSWQGHEVINNVDTDEAGVDWILAENWVPYQRPSFVTPPFAAYVSGHSTFSRAAAEVLTLITGDAFFPGGMGTFLAEQDEFLVFEDGPSVDVELQWATYRDAADQSGLSRIWGGIHPPADDIPGRLMGIEIGLDAYYHARTHFIDLDENGSADYCENCEPVHVVSLPHGPVDVFHWLASNYVEGNSVIPADANITFDGKNCVILSDGFEVELGAEFLGITDGCN